MFVRGRSLLASVVERQLLNSNCFLIERPVRVIGKIIGVGAFLGEGRTLITRGHLRDWRH